MYGMPFASLFNYQCLYLINDDFSMKIMCFVKLTWLTEKNKVVKKIFDQQRCFIISKICLLTITQMACYTLIYKLCYIM